MVSYIDDLWDINLSPNQNKNNILDLRDSESILNDDIISQYINENNQNWFRSSVDDYSSYHYQKRGEMRGVLSFRHSIADNIFKQEGKDLIVVTDKSRNNIKYRSPDGSIVIDKGCLSMGNKIYPLVKRQGNLVAVDYFEE